MSAHLNKQEAEEYLEMLAAAGDGAFKNKIAVMKSIMPDDGSINMFTLQSALFPNAKEENWKYQFSRFKDKFNKTAKENEIEVLLAADNSRGELNRRRCRIERNKEMVVFNFNKGGTEPRKADEEVALRAFEQKKLYKFFVSYAEKDQEKAQDLIERLRQFLKTMLDSDFDFWLFSDKLLPGEKQEKEIEEVVN